MKYIVHRRFKHNAICGEVNLPAMTECESVDNVICLEGKELCVTTSLSAHQYFARNDDGQGMLRGKLTQNIMKALEAEGDPRTDTVYQAKWDKVWDDELCQQYKRIEHADFWLWNHDFYNAPIEDLRHIAALVGAKED